MTEEQHQEPRRGAAGGIGEGLRSGIGILTALKDAIEQTIQEAAERGDLTPERARQAMRDTMRRVQDGVDEARDRLDFVPRREHEALQAQLVDLRARVEALERRVYNVSGDSGIVFEAE